MELARERDGEVAGPGSADGRARFSRPVLAHAQEHTIRAVFRPAAGRVYDLSFRHHAGSVDGRTLLSWISLPGDRAEARCDLGGGSHRASFWPDSLHPVWKCLVSRADSVLSRRGLDDGASGNEVGGRKLSGARRL